MIRLFSKGTTDFTTLGLGVLRDALTAVVKEELNGSYEFEFTYPLGGKLFDQLSEEKIVVVKPNQIDSEQAFRIYEISRPINGIVTVSCEHISYDMSGYPVGAIDAESLADSLSQIQNGIIGVVQSPFVFHTDKTSNIEWKTDRPASMRSLLSGGDKTLQKVYGGEFKFDNFDVYLYEARGVNRGICVRYGKQMTDITNTTSSENVYTAVFPFYYSATKETVTTETMTYEQAYIVAGSTPLSRGWLSMIEGGEPYTTLIQDIPVQIATEGEYKGNVYQWDETNQTWYIPDPIPEPHYKQTSSTKQDVVNYVTLPEVYIWMGDGMFDPHQRVLTLDMTSEFSTSELTSSSTGTIAPPTPDMLRSKTMAYLDKTKIGRLTNEVEVSFEDLSKYLDDQDIAAFEKVGIGDTVQVIYEELGVKVTKTVIAYEFDVLTDQYSEVTLGDKEKSLSDTALTSNDNISSLTNDVQFCDRTTVNELIAKTVTADFVQALNANLSNAQIDQLKTERIQCTGIIEAAQFDIDKVVSNFLVAQNAEIYQTLLAGSIKVKGEITATSGVIGGCTINNGVLEVANANITGTITANHIVCDSVVSTGLNTQLSAQRTAIENALNTYSLTATVLTVTDGSRTIFQADAAHNVALIDIRTSDGTKKLLYVNNTESADSNKVIINADVAVAKSICVGSTNAPIFAADSTTGEVVIDIQAPDSTPLLYVNNAASSASSRLIINGTVLTGQIPTATAHDAITETVDAGYVNALGIAARSILVSNNPSSPSLSYTMLNANAQTGYFYMNVLDANGNGLIQATNSPTPVVKIGPFMVYNGALISTSDDSGSGAIRVTNDSGTMTASLRQGTFYAASGTNGSELGYDHLYRYSGDGAFAIGSAIPGAVLRLTSDVINVEGLVKFNGGNIVSSLPQTAPAGAVYFLKNT